MSSSPDPNPELDPIPLDDPDDAGALQDPRTVHPSPEGLFPDPTGPAATLPAPDPFPADPVADRPPDEGAGGMVDPRHDPFGPDLGI